MSKIFYDHLISFTKVEIHLKKITSSKDEREELWKIIDDMLHNRMLTKILDNLPKELHSEFLSNFHSAPHNEDILLFLNDHIEEDIEELIKSEAETLMQEILEEMGLK